MATVVLMSAFRPNITPVPQWWAEGGEPPLPDWCNDPDLQIIANETTVDGVPSMNAINAAARIAPRAGVTGVPTLDMVGQVLYLAALLCQ